MYYDTSKWFLLFICIPNSSSVSIIIPREIIHLFLFMLCLSAKNLPVFAQILLRAWSVHVLYILIKIYLIKYRLVYTSTLMFKLYLQSLNTILASIELFFQFRIRNQMIQSWNSILISWTGRPNACPNVINTQLVNGMKCV